MFFDWIHDHPALVAWLSVLSVVMFLAGLVLTPWVITRLPADYFVRQSPPTSSWRTRHPAVRVLLRIAKNAVGVALVLAGIAMLVLPGQGILTIIVGLLLLDLPGERRLEVWILERRPVKKAVDWLRKKAGRDPLLLPSRVSGEALSSPDAREDGEKPEAERP